MAGVRSRISEREVDNDVLEGRVRSKLGFLVRHPSAIITQISNGRVVLSGPVLADEVQQLIAGLHAVRGVTDVVNRLEIHDDPAQASGLQGDKPKPAGEVWDIMQRHWSPSTRFLVGTAGAVSLGLIAYSLTDGAPRRGQERANQERAGTGWRI